MCVNCKEVIYDVFGDHATGCKENGRVVRRHDNITKILVQACKEGHLEVSEEVLGHCEGGS